MCWVGVLYRIPKAMQRQSIQVMKCITNKDYQFYAIFTIRREIPDLGYPGEVHKRDRIRQNIWCADSCALCGVPVSGSWTKGRPHAAAPARRLCETKRRRAALGVTSQNKASKSKLPHEAWGPLGPH